MTIKENLLHFGYNTNISWFAFYSKILFQIASACPKYDNIFRKLLTDPDPDTDMYKFNQQHSDLFKYISKHTGEVHKYLFPLFKHFTFSYIQFLIYSALLCTYSQNYSNILQSVAVYDALEVQRDSNLKLPAWTESIFPDKMSLLKRRIFDLFTETPYMRRIKGGLLITEIVDKMIKKQTEEITQNILVYSGHDSTIRNMVRGMNVTDQVPEMPGYGASLIFELHCNDEYSAENPRCVIKVSNNLRASFKMQLHGDVFLADMVLFEYER